MFGDQQEEKLKSVYYQKTNFLYDERHEWTNYLKNHHKNYVGGILENFGSILVGLTWCHLIGFETKEGMLRKMTLKLLEETVLWVMSLKFPGMLLLPSPAN